MLDPHNVEDAFQDAKSCDVCWITLLNGIDATGLSKQAKHELKLYYLRDLSK